MADLRRELEAMSFQKVTTLLNSGNVIFYYREKDPAKLSELVADQLEKVFKFSIATIVVEADTLLNLLNAAPFKDEILNKEQRGYVSILQKKTSTDLKLPWISEDKSLKILRASDQLICSFLDLSITKTPEAMKILEQLFGKQMTTRNWNTIIKICDTISTG
jgi:uncharacterized protein (DUF1697 family)